VPGGQERESKTEQPTARRLAEARNRGSVARSQDLNVAFLMLAVLVSLFLFGERILTKLRIVADLYLGGEVRFSFEPATVAGSFGRVVLQVLDVIYPVVLLIFVVMLLVNLFQVGFLLTTKPLAPELTKLSPLRGLSRIVSLRGGAKAALGVFKILVIGSVLVWTLWEELVAKDVLQFLYNDSSAHHSAHRYALSVILLMGFRAVIALLILALIDYIYQRWQFRRDLMMTKQEVKEEMLQMEGDPKMKGRRQSVHQDILRQSMMRDVPRSDVVITNPTHFAVAIRYDRRTMSSPRCLAKGRGVVAQRIREVAMENRVPVVQRPELARALYAAVEVGDEIPEEFYRAVAEVLAYVYRLSRGAAAAAG
jgi:flagellar biosynthetic protein FlhB